MCQRVRVPGQEPHEALRVAGDADPAHQGVAPHAGEGGERQHEVQEQRGWSDQYAGCGQSHPPADDLTWGVQRFSNHGG